MEDESVLVGTYNVLKTQYDHTFKIYNEFYKDDSIEEIELKVKESILRNIDGYTLVREQ